MTGEILILTSDPQLLEELELALDALGPSAPMHQVASSHARAVQMMGNRPPQILIVELGTDLDQVRKLAQETRAISPMTKIAAVFRPDMFNDDVSESGLIIEAMRAGIRDFLRRPVSTNELRQLLEDTNRLEEFPAHDRCRVVTFVSNKGGVGKSTLSVNSAVGLAMRRPGRVLLIDASLQLGVAAPMLDLKPTTTLTQVAHQRDRLDASMLKQMALQHESGLYVLPAPLDAIEATEIDDELITRIITLARLSFDFVIIDTFPLFDRVIVSVLDMSDLVFVVTENVVPTLLGAVKLVEVLERIGVNQEKQQIILNRYTSIAGSVPAVDVADRLDREIRHIIPFDKQVVTCANTGDPFAMKKTWFSKTQTAMQGIVDEIENLTPGASGAAGSLAGFEPGDVNDE